MTTDELYMRRAIQLATMGGAEASPNPRVGAVIVADGVIIGEGFHRKCGEPHAEVNAVRSVHNSDMLSRSTIYVTLEPCAHYGKTPPCAKLLIDNHIPRVVIGCQDPFGKVNGLGIKMLRDAGADVTCGVLEEECKALNRKFMTAHTLKRPYVTLKWAQTADGFIGSIDADGRAMPLQISNTLSRMEVHKLRSEHDAIMVGSGTVIADNPALDTRCWSLPSPRIVVADRRNRIPPGAKVLTHDDTIVINHPYSSISELLHTLYCDYGITSLLVEGGAQLLQSYLDCGLYDSIRREISPMTVGKGIVAPHLPEGIIINNYSNIRGNIIQTIDVKNI